MSLNVYGVTAYYIFTVCTHRIGSDFDRARVGRARRRVCPPHATQWQGHANLFYTLPLTFIIISAFFILLYYRDVYVGRTIDKFRGD